MVRPQIDSAPEAHRRAVTRDLEDGAPKADVTALFALGESGQSDVASTTDGCVVDAIAIRRRR